MRGTRGVRPRGRGPGDGPRTDRVECGAEPASPATAWTASTCGHCAWGDRAGVTVGDVDATLPTPPPTRAGLGADEVGAADREAARWSMLLDDPLLELRVVGAGAARAARLAGGHGRRAAARPAGARPAARASAAGPTLGPALDASGLTEAELRAAARAVADSPELAAAARAVPPSDPELLEAVAGAVVATALAGHRTDPHGPGATRRRRPDRPRRAGRGHVRGTRARPRRAGSSVMSSSGPSAGSSPARRRGSRRTRRSSIMGLHSWTIADVLSYQRRSDAILDVIRGRPRGDPGAARSSRWGIASAGSRSSTCFRDPIDRRSTCSSPSGPNRRCSTRSMRSARCASGRAARRSRPG